MFDVHVDENSKPLATGKGVRLAIDDGIEIVSWGLRRHCVDSSHRPAPKPLLFVFVPLDRMTIARLIAGPHRVGCSPRRMTSGNGAYCRTNMQRTLRNECARHRLRRNAADQ